VYFDADQPEKVSSFRSCTIASVSSPVLQSVPMLDFSRQFAPVREEILAAIAEVCDSQVFILGPKVGEFEMAAAEACGSTFAIGCSSGTEALWLALAAAGVGGSTSANFPSKPGIGVITSPFSFFATASSILRAGARPIFADIDPRTFNLSPESVEDILKNPSCPPVQAVLPVHLYGQCADMDAFEEMERRHPGLLIIEDAAQAFGAKWRDRGAGSLGTAAAFSFYPTKNLAAFGDAGLVTTSSAELAERSRTLRTHGMKRRYFHDEVGWNSRIDAIQAAVLQVKLRYLPEGNRQRRERASRYDELFRAAGLVGASIQEGIVLPWVDPRATHVFHQYVIRAPRRDALREYLSNQGVGSEIYYPVPIHLQAALKGLGYKPGDFPHAEAACAEVLALPMYPELRDDEQQTVVEAVRRFYA
jgi:dTDP-4-amino-4,6-dideoxygalactose transaminase